MPQQVALTRSELQAAILEKEQTLAHRQEVLKAEAQEAPQQAQNAIADDPLPALGAALAGGLAFGLLFGGGRKRRRLRKRRKAQRQLLDAYLDALAREGGKKRSDLPLLSDDERPVLLLQQEGFAEATASTGKGFWAQVLDLAAKTAIGFGVKIALDALTQQLDLEQQLQGVLEEALREEEEDDAGVVEVGAAVSEETPPA